MNQTAKHTINNNQASTPKNNFPISDNGPEEPELCKLSGFDDCERCYFRISTVERITQNVKQLRGEA